MSLLHGVLAFGRARTEVRMTETVTATAPTTPVTDPDTLATSTPPGAVLYTGIAEVHYGSDAINLVEVAARPATVQTPFLRIPPGPLLPEHTRVVVDASTTDQSLVGRVYVTEGAPESGAVTAHRYRLVEVRP